MTDGPPKLPASLLEAPSAAFALYSATFALALLLPRPSGRLGEKSDENRVPRLPRGEKCRDGADAVATSSSGIDSRPSVLTDELACTLCRTSSSSAGCVCPLLRAAASAASSSLSRSSGMSSSNSLSARRSSSVRTRFDFSRLSGFGRMLSWLLGRLLAAGPLGPAAGPLGLQAPPPPPPPPPLGSALAQAAAGRTPPLPACNHVVSAAAVPAADALSSAACTDLTHAVAIAGFELRNCTFRVAMLRDHAPPEPSFAEQTPGSSGSAFTIRSQSASRKMSRVLRPRMIHLRAQSPPLPPFSTNPLRRLGGGKQKSSAGAGEVRLRTVRSTDTYCSHSAGVSAERR